MQHDLPRRRPFCGAVLFIAAVMALTGTSTSVSQIGDRPIAQAPAKGVFLLASRELLDPNFRRTVIFLLQHDDEGSLGLVINRQTDVLLSAALPDIKGVVGVPHRLSLGGPVAVNTVLFLTRAEAQAPPGVHVIDQISFGMQRSLLEQLLAEGRSEGELQVYAGHAGWAPGQLDHEIAQGAWHVIGADPGIIFDAKANQLWDTLIQRYDPPGLLVRRPPDDREHAFVQAQF